MPGSVLFAGWDPVGLGRDTSATHQWPVEIHRAVPADRWVRPLAGAVAGPVRGCGLAVPLQWAVAGDACRARPVGDRLRTLPRVAGRRCLHRPAGRPGRPGGKNRLVAGQRGLHRGPRSPRRRRDAGQQAPREALEEAAQEQEAARQKGAARRSRTDRPDVGASGADTGSA